MLQLMHHSYISHYLSIYLAKLQAKSKKVRKHILQMHFEDFK